MPVVRNKTRKSIRVPLGRGKVLHLGPLMDGSVTVAATERPAFAKLVKAGEIELLDGAGHADFDPSDPSKRGESSRGFKQKQVRRRGDR